MPNDRRSIVPRSPALFAVAVKRLSALACAGVAAWAGGCHAPSEDAAPSPSSPGVSTGVVESPAGAPREGRGRGDPCAGTVCAFGRFCCPTTVSCQFYTSMDVAAPGPLPITASLDVTGMSAGAWASASLPSQDFGSGAAPDVVRVDVAGDRVEILVDSTPGDLAQCDCESAEIALHVEGWQRGSICMDAACEVRCCDSTLDQSLRDEYCTSGCWDVYPFFTPAQQTVTRHGAWTQFPGTRSPVCYLSASVDTTAFDLGEVISTTVGAKGPSGEHLAVGVYAQKGSF